MFIRNKYFILAVVAIIFQQLLLAGSTWSIAEAGAAVSLNDFALAKNCVLGFFALALAAYTVSSFSELLSVNSENSLWGNYSKSVVAQACKHSELSSSKNRKRISQWVCTEAMTAINSANGYYLGAISVLANILLTSFVFFTVLGPVIGSSVLASLVISLAFVLVARSRIQSLSTQMQQSKMTVFAHIDNWLVSSFFGTSTMSSRDDIRFEKNSAQYFFSIRSYIVTEQVVACVPIAISVIIISMTLLFMKSDSAVHVGMLVAILPRSLQLLGNVHALSLYLSQFVMIGQRLKNLESFTADLERQDFTSQISSDMISIVEATTGRHIANSDLMSIIGASNTSGRYLVMGPNGSGKSTLLRLIKSKTDSCILVTPGAHFGSPDNNHSTGQLLLAELSMLFSEPAQIMLLDEWDANLDADNIARINAKIQELSKTRVVVEVRHKASSVVAIQTS